MPFCKLNSQNMNLKLNIFKYIHFIRIFSSVYKTEYSYKNSLFHLKLHFYLKNVLYSDLFFIGTIIVPIKNKCFDSF